MKTNVIVASLTFLLIVTYLLVMQIHPEEYGDMSRFVPGNALLYVEQRQATAELKRITNSRLGTKIASINFQKTGVEIGLSDDKLSKLNKFLSVVKRAKDDPVVHEILGKRFAVAVMPPLGGEAPNDFYKYFKENSVIIAEPKHKANILGFIVENYGYYNDEVSISFAQYGKHHIKRIALLDVELSLVMIDGFFVISFSERQLRRCLDAFDSRSSSLSKNAEFNALKKNFNEPGRFLYLPVENVRNFAKTLLGDMSFPQKNILLKELDTTKGFSSFGYGAWLGRSSIEDKIAVRFNSSKVNALVKEHVRIEPTKCTMFSLVSKHPILYYWSNTFNFEHLLLYLEDNAKLDAKIDSFMSRFAMIAGKNPTETLSLLGDEVSFVVEKSSENTQFSVPLATFFVEVEVVEELKIILEKLVVEYEIPMIEKQYGSATYYYWSRSFEDGIRPLYGFSGNYLFLGNSTKLLKEILDAQGSGHTLTDHPKVGKVDPGLRLANNSLTYMDNVELINIIKDIIDIFGTMIAIQDREAAFKIRVIIDSIVTPLLDGATAFDSSATRSYFTPDTVIINSKTNLIN